MILFDGTDLQTLERSLASCLHFEVDDFVNCYTEYFCMNAAHLGEISLQGFRDYWLNKRKIIDFATLKFDNAMFFHKTSVIDNRDFIHNNGLLPFNDIILKPSPLKDYLGSKGIEFYIKNGIPFINKNGNSSIVQNNNMAINPREKAENTIFIRLTNLEGVGIGGYLLLPLALSDHSYDHIKEVPEFLYFLNNWFPGISDDWKHESTPYIVKCNVNLSWLDMLGENTRQLNIHEKSLRIAEDGFLSMAEFWATDLFHTRIQLLTNWYYPFIHKSKNIPPSNIIEFIEY